jgi:hypothetical protein
MRRRLRPLLVTACLLAVVGVLAGCHTDDAPIQVDPVGQITFGGYIDNGKNFTVQLTNARPKGKCTDEITYMWDGPGEPLSTDLMPELTGSTGNCTGQQEGVSRTLKIPTRSSGGVINVQLAYNYNGERTFAWMAVEIPAARAPAPAPPSVVVFAHASPAGDAGPRLLDARLSTGTGALSYAWSPTECAGTSYESGSGSVAAPAGTAGVAPNYSGECTVTVTQANGESASASVSVGSTRGLRNGFFTFNNSTSATISGSYYGLPGEARTACVDLTGTGSYSTPVALTGANPSTGTVVLTSLSPGTHKIAATLWSGGDNATCTNTSTTGAVQTISDLYTVDSAGAVRRGLRSSSFVAPSSMRFVPTKTLTEGAGYGKSGVISGATMVGSFSWATPTSSKGVKRPVGAAKLAKGTYVMRSVDMLQGPLVGKATTMLGTGTMLLRGVDGTMACGTLAGGFDSSTITLAGGTRSARTLAGVLTGERVTYVWPTPASVAARSGGALGMLATALGWVAGDQPADRAKKPAKKPKLPKVRPVKGSGTASLQTAARPTGLPASCKALVKYLPQ